MCGKTDTCFDVASKFLPDKKPKPRHIYRNSHVEKELEDIKRQLDALRKHNQDHFTLAALVEMELASERLSKAIEIIQLSPKFVEEIN
jgi:hypothetical protein